MNWRRIIYITALLFIAGIIFTNITETKQAPPEKLLNQKVVLQEFADPNHPIYEEERFQPSFIYFPYDYTGDKGDEFYLTLKSDENITTVKYVLEKDASGVLKYDLHDRWLDINLPKDRFESYSYQNGGWVLVNQF